MFDIDRFEHSKARKINCFKSLVIAALLCLFFIGLAGVAAISIVGAILAPFLIVAAAVVPILAFFGREAECPHCFEKAMVFPLIKKVTKCNTCKEKLKIVKVKNIEYLIVLNRKT